MNAAPLLVSFNKIESYLKSLPEKQKERYSREITNLLDKGLPPVVSHYCLAILFGYSLEFVNALAKKQHKFYRTFPLKQGKKIRQIEAPKVSLKVIQKWLGFHLAQSLPFPAHVFGFISGLSALKAAEQHLGGDWVYSIDIKDFFPSITKNQVAQSFKELGYSENGAGLIAKLCCLNERLAQGSPTSPVISNMVMKDIDAGILNIANESKATVTRYADDVVFSGQGLFPDKIKQEVRDLFESSEWSLNEEKEYLAETAKGQRLKVHGLLVMGDKVKLTKGYRNKIRAYRHMIEKGKVSEDDLPRILGHIHYANSIDDLSK